MNPADMEALLDLGLLRHTEGDRHVVTSAGWAASVQIMDSTGRDRSHPTLTNRSRHRAR